MGATDLREESKATQGYLNCGNNQQSITWLIFFHNLSVPTDRVTIFFIPLLTGQCNATMCKGQKIFLLILCRVDRIVPYGA